MHWKGTLGGLVGGSGTAPPATQRPPPPLPATPRHTDDSPRATLGSLLPGAAVAVVTETQVVEVVV